MRPLENLVVKIFDSKDVGEIITVDSKIGVEGGVNSLKKKEERLT